MAANTYRTSNIWAPELQKDLVKVRVVQRLMRQLANMQPTAVNRSSLRLFSAPSRVDVLGATKTDSDPSESTYKPSAWVKILAS